jgi:anti-anti-sigma regulatory factor/anti-sigma regulatory factor (Ser/Thr protein kinase)
MRTTTERSLETGVTTVRLTGELTVTTMTTVRSAIGKAAAECPIAVVVDLSGFRRAGRVSLSLFATATYQAQLNWGVPVLLCAAEPEIGRELRAFRSYVALYDDHWRAVTAVRAYVPRWMRQQMAPVPASAAAARALVGHACRTWNLAAVRDAARLVASELAANAIVHARTAFDVTAAYTGRYLRIAVHDGSPAKPRLQMALVPDVSPARYSSGRGLHVVAAVSAHWGCARVPGGKIVWALIGGHPGGR